MVRAGSHLRTWFFGELSSFVPSWFGAMFLGVPAAKRLTFAPGADVVTGVTGGLVAPAELLGPLPPDLTARHRETVDVELPAAFFLTRRIEAPEAGAGAFLKVAELDLIRRTPFQLSGVYWSLTPPTRENGRVAAMQWIAKRSDINTLRQRLQSAGLSLRRILVEGHPEAGVIADLSSSRTGSGQRLRRLNGSLTVAALALAGAAWLAPAWTAKSELERVANELTALRAEAVGLRAEVDQLRALDTKRGEFLDSVVFHPRLVEVLHDLSAALPDTTWLSELIFRPDGVTLTGETTGTATALVISLSKTNTIMNPRLTGVVSRTAQGAEHFELTFDVGAAP